MLGFWPEKSVHIVDPSACSRQVFIFYFFSAYIFLLYRSGMLVDILDDIIPK